MVRAADVCVKERRQVVLLVRETPLHAGHIRLQQATENGPIAMPPVPAFYQLPQNQDEVVSHTVYRALDLFGLDSGKLPRWLRKGQATQRRSGEAVLTASAASSAVDGKLLVEHGRGAFLTPAHPGTFGGPLAVGAPLWAGEVLGLRCDQSARMLMHR
ncbi:hypothetical protein ACSSVZ_002202 [Amorphus sp. MBR-141]